MFGKIGVGNMIKKAKEMQENMKKMQEELAQKTVTGQAGAGAVTITMNGLSECQKVELNPEILKEDREMIEALLASAINDANKRVQEISKQSMDSITGGVNIPGLKFPF